MSTQTHYYPYAQQAAQRQRRALTAIMASVTAINAHVTTAAIADHHPMARKVSSKDETPPEAAEDLLYIFLPREDREALLGDLEEEYWTDILPKLGVKRAKRWYWGRALINIWPANSGAISRLAWWLIDRFTS